MASLQNVTTFIKDNIGTIAAGVGGVALGGVLGAAVASKVAGSSGKRKSGSSRRGSGRSRDRKYISKQKHEKAYQRYKRKHKVKSRQKYYRTKKRRGKGRRAGTHYTKNGQPYIILASGKARFIKKRGR